MRRLFRLAAILAIVLASTFVTINLASACGSNEWCCKHDIGGSGACTKCCKK